MVLDDLIEIIKWLKHHQPTARCSTRIIKKY
jgi:hypothetical protein